MSYPILSTDTFHENTMTLPVEEMSQLIGIILEELGEENFGITEDLFLRLRDAFDTLDIRIGMSDGSIQAEGDYHRDLVIKKDGKYYIGFEEFTLSEIHEIISAYIGEDDIEGYVRLLDSLQGVNPFSFMREGHNSISERALFWSNFPGSFITHVTGKIISSSWGKRMNDSWSKLNGL